MSETDHKPTGRPAKLVGPHKPDIGLATLLPDDDLALPPAGSRFGRSDAASLVAATLLHLAILAIFLAPERGLGVGGLEADSIGVDIVTAAPALEARPIARGRGDASARTFAEEDGDVVAMQEEAAAPDSLREDRPAPSESAPPPADLVVRDWNQTPRLDDVPLTEPLIARTKADGETREQPERPMARPDEPPAPAADSRSASEVLARFRGGAASRGREMAELPEIVIAAARAGQRDEYKLAIYRAISANQPRGLAGQAGIVKVEFRVMPDGSVTDVRIAASSRSRQLDENVMATMRGLRLPPPPRTLTADRLIYDLEFTFQ